MAAMFYPHVMITTAATCSYHKRYRTQRGKLKVVQCGGPE